MVPTRAEIITYAQFLAGDPSGTIFVDSASPGSGQINMGLAFESAFREIWTTYDYYQIPTAVQTAWYNLPAETTQATPAQMGLTNFETLATLEERNIGSTVNISTCDTSSPINVTAASSLSAGGIGNNTEVLVSGVVGQTGANGRWLVTLSNDTHLALNGSASVGAYVSGGVMTTSNDYYDSLMQVTELPQWLPDSRLLVYVFNNNTFYFVGATNAVELRIAYYASGTAPATGSVGIDDSKDFLSYRTAAICAALIGNERAQNLDAQATAYLNFHITPLIRQQQRNPIHGRAYRTGGSKVPSVTNPSGVLFS